MKKIIALLFLVAFSVAFVSAQDRDGRGGPGRTEIVDKETAGDQISQVVTTVFDKSSEAVKSLSEALRVPAERVYTVLTKQQVVKAIVWISITLLFLITGGVLISNGNRAWDKANKEYIEANKDNNYRNKALAFFDDDQAWTYSWIFGLIILVVGLIIFAASSVTILTGFFNPEYGAIKEIMEVL